MTSVPLPPPPLSSQSMADLLCTIILLLRGADERGRDFWAYMCIKPSMAQTFHEARSKGAFDLEEYGTVIIRGDGKEVPVDVQTRMEREFGVNHRYEEDLLAAIKAYS